MTVAVQAPQDTGARPARTGPLTVPLQIAAAVGARHRKAVAERRATPAWALLAVTAAAALSIGIAVAEWRGIDSVLLIVFAVVGAAAAFGSDVHAVIISRRA